MPQNLRELKTRIRTSHNIAQIAKTLEMVSVSKIRRARALALTVRPYAERLVSLLGTTLGAFPEGVPEHPFLRPTPSAGRLVIALGPDKGLCGPLPGNIVRRLLDLADSDVSLITVGRRLDGPASRTGARHVAAFPLGTQLPRYSLVYELARLTEEIISSGRASTLEVLYPRFESFFSQVVTVQRMLPLEDTAIVRNVDAAPLEPDPRALLDALVPHVLETRLFDAVLQTYASEQAARMVAMQNAKSNAFEIAESFTLLYNKTRQERITSEILDLANTG
jgi:F-type H+-transporting ATPase subunit gamma